MRASFFAGVVAACCVFAAHAADGEQLPARSCDGAPVAQDPLGRGYWAVDAENDAVLLVTPAPEKSKVRPEVRSFSVGRWPERLVVDSTGRVYVSVRGDSMIAVIAPDLASQNALTVPAEPRALVLDEPGHSLYVASVTARTVTRIDVTSGVETARLAIPDEPTELTSTPDALFVGARRSSKVYVAARSLETTSLFPVELPKRGREQAWHTQALVPSGDGVWVVYAVVDTGLETVGFSGGYGGDVSEPITTTVAFVTASGEAHPLTFGADEDFERVSDTGVDITGAAVEGNLLVLLSRGLRQVTTLHLAGKRTPVVDGLISTQALPAGMTGLVQVGDRQWMTLSIVDRTLITLRVKSPEPPARPMPLAGHLASATQTQRTAPVSAAPVQATKLPNAPVALSTALAASQNTEQPKTVVALNAAVQAVNQANAPDALNSALAAAQNAKQPNAPGAINPAPAAVLTATQLNTSVAMNTASAEAQSAKHPNAPGEINAAPVFVLTATQPNATVALNTASSAVEPVPSQVRATLELATRLNTPVSMNAASATTQPAASLVRTAPVGPATQLNAPVTVEASSATVQPVANMQLLKILGAAPSGGIFNDVGVHGGLTELVGVSGIGLKGGWGTGLSSGKGDNVFGAPEHHFIARVVRVLPLGPTRLDKQLALGRKLFYEASSEAISGPVLSCATCHVDGREDGLVWRLRGTRRQTPMLATRVADSAPYNWHGTQQALDDSIAATVERLGGEGIPKRQRLALARFLREGLPPVTAPKPELPDALVARGRELFEGAASCGECHTSEGTGTDGAEHDVGTLSSIERIEVVRARGKRAVAQEAAFDTPTLKHVALTAPYFHDGSVASLEELVENDHDRMGTTSQLSAEEKAALVAYLKTL